MASNPLEELAEGVTWFDDWYALETIAPGVTAIGEPRYHQINWNYLIECENSALLFDTGPGERDISIVVRTLTVKPVIAMPSHMHYDHTGNLHRFTNIAIADIPVLRNCMRNGKLEVPDDLHLGSHENRPWVPVTVTRWIKPGETLDLGKRNLVVIATPGHAIDEVSLFDASANILFAADFTYPGELYAQLPGSNLEDYLQAARIIANTINDETLILSAHGQPEANGNHAAPILRRTDIVDLMATLEQLKFSGAQPARIVVNDHMVLLTAPNAFAPWQSQ